MKLEVPPGLPLFSILWQFCRIFLIFYKGTFLQKKLKETCSWDNDNGVCFSWQKRHFNLDIQFGTANAQNFRSI